MSQTAFVKPTVPFVVPTKNIEIGLETGDERSNRKSKATTDAVTKPEYAAFLVRVMGVIPPPNADGQ
jgi:hypothetical protein